MVWSVIVPPFARLMSEMVTPYLIARPARLSTEDTLCVRNMLGSEGDPVPCSSSSISPMMSQPDETRAPASSPRPLRHVCPPRDGRSAGRYRRE